MDQSNFVPYEWRYTYHAPKGPSSEVSRRTRIIANIYDTHIFDSREIILSLKKKFNELSTRWQNWAYEAGVTGGSYLRQMQRDQFDRY